MCLRSGLSVGAGLFQGGNGPVPYQIAKLEYDECLMRYRREDGIQDLLGPMSLIADPIAHDYSRLTPYPSSIPEE